MIMTHIPNASKDSTEVTKRTLQRRNNFLKANLSIVSGGATACQTASLLKSFTLEIRIAILKKAHITPFIDEKSLVAMKSDLRLSIYCLHHGAMWNIFLLLLSITWTNWTSKLYHKVAALEDEIDVANEYIDLIQSAMCMQVSQDPYRKRYWWITCFLSTEFPKWNNNTEITPLGGPCCKFHGEMGFVIWYLWWTRCRKHP